MQVAWELDFIFWQWTWTQYLKEWCHFFHWPRVLHQRLRIAFLRPMVCQSKYLVGRYSPVLKLPKMWTWAAGQINLMQFSILSTTPARIRCSSAEGTIHWKKSSISWCNLKNTNLNTILFYIYTYLIYLLFIKWGSKGTFAISLEGNFV